MIINPNNIINSDHILRSRKLITSFNISSSNNNSVRRFKLIKKSYSAFFYITIKISFNKKRNNSYSHCFRFLVRTNNFRKFSTIHCSNYSIIRSNDNIISHSFKIITRDFINFCRKLNCKILLTISNSKFFHFNKYFKLNLFCCITTFSRNIITSSYTTMSIIRIILVSNNTTVIIRVKRITHNVYLIFYLNYSYYLFCWQR